MEWSLDYSWAMKENIGPGGLESSDLESVGARTRKTMISLLEGREKGDPLFPELPYYRDPADRVKDWAHKNRGKFDNFVLLGIGGSALGPRALVDALCHPYAKCFEPDRRGDMRVFVCDNVDPWGIGGIFDTVDLSRTVFNVVSKSGGTAEVMSLYLIVRDKLIKKFGADKLGDRMVFTTDPENGVLRKLAQDEGITAFEIPPGVGGRYSVLTPVGLLPAAAAGINVDGLLDGASSMDLRCRSGEIMDNPAALFAAMAYLFHTRRNRNIMVIMPYSNGLLTLAEWFQQLWAESLGKEKDLSGKTVNTGSTPVRALGATDQHSQLQLYMEGPDDKLVVFLRVETPHRDIEIPKIHSDIAAINYLGGHTLAELLNAEQEATAAALAKQGRPSITITVDEVSAHAIGALMYFFEVATALGGGLYNVNPYDQPGVELAKKLTYGMMGREGYEKENTQPSKRMEIGIKPKGND